MYTYQAKDGTLITDIPDDIPRNDPRLRARYEQMKSQGIKTDSYAGVQPTAMDPSQVPARGARPEQAQQTGIMEGLKQGTAAAVRGLVGGVANTVGMVTDPVVAVTNLILDAVGAPPEIRGQRLGEATKNLLDIIGVPESETQAAKIVEAASRGLSGAATGIGAGGAIASAAPALGASMPGAIGASLASGPVQQALGGIGSEVASEVAGQMGASPAVQAAAGLAGGVAGSTAGNIANLRRGAVNPMQGVVDDSARFRTELMTSDVNPPRTFAGKTGQALAEKIPVVGTGGMRATQQANRIQDVKDILRRFGAYDAAEASDEVMSDLVSKRAGNFNRWENMKEEALKAVETAKPGEKVPMSKTIKTIDDSIAYIKSLNNPDLEPAIQKLNNAKQSFMNQSPENVLKNKQILGDIFDAPEMGALKRAASNPLKKTYESVTEDLTDFIKEAGGEQAKNKWMIANKEETKLFKELDLDILKNTLEKGVDRPEVVKNMLFNKDRSVIESLNRNLSAKGREAAKTAIMQRVAEKIGEDASPDKFLTEMRKLRSGGDPVGVFFTGDDLKVVEGLTRVLKATERASKAALNPPTGVQAVIPLSIIGMGGGSVALEKYFGQGLLGVLGSAATVGGLGAGARVYESPAVRNILMKLPTVKPGAKEETALFNRLFEVLKAQESKEQK